jgi:alkylation response protein AidB-like acyl-CoA dehydrogenase
MDRFELRLQDYALTEDQDSVRDAFAEFFSKESPTTAARAAEPLGHDPSLWAKLVEMGVTSMSLPSESGGDDATLVDLVLIAEEVGRSVAPVPFVSHVVATRLLAAAGAPDEALESAIAGDNPVTVALQPAGAGRAQLVPDAAIAADVIALTGDSPSEFALALHRAERPSDHVHNQGSTPLGWWQPGDGQRIVELATGDEAVDCHRRAVAEWKLLMAAALIGMTEAALAIAVDFVKTRETMGVPVGALQGVAFPLADIAIGTSGARNLIWRAAWMAEYDPDARPELIAAAWAYANQVATKGTTTAAHMQGGLGFTVEADASLFFLRARGWGALGGDTEQDLAAVGRALVDRAGS